MGELLRAYLGEDNTRPSRAFWLGASRILDSRPVISGAVIEAMFADDEQAPDDWGIVGGELREAMEHAEANGQEEQGK